jgi:hypothetical protein
VLITIVTVPALSEVKAVKGCAFAEIAVVQLAIITEVTVACGVIFKSEHALPINVATVLC